MSSHTYYYKYSKMKNSIEKRLLKMYFVSKSNQIRIFFFTRCELTTLCIPAQDSIPQVYRNVISNKIKSNVHECTARWNKINFKLFCKMQHILPTNWIFNIFRLYLSIFCWKKKLKVSFFLLLLYFYINFRAFNTGIYFQNRFFGIQKFQNRDSGFKTGFEIFDK
jgi:hypothetical protein